MSPPLRAAVGTFIAVFAAAIWFLPLIDPEVKAVLGLCVMLVSAFVHPQTNESENEKQLPRIIWAERDAGEKFSIVMFHAVILVALAFSAMQLAQLVEGLLGNILAASVMCAGVWLTVRNWKNRNAR